MTTDGVDRSTFDLIEVYCDDARHARGKVAEIGTAVLLNGPYPWGWIGSRFRRTERTELSTTWLSGVPSSAFACPLCPRRPALTGEHIVELFDSLARAGVSRVSLAVLDSYAAQVSGEG